MSKRPDFLVPGDPLFPLQWHLSNNGDRQNAVAGEDINVKSIWPDYTGRGVIIAVVDDGFDGFHPDLQNNYLYSFSRDLTSGDIGASPVNIEDDDHGTSVAGLIASSQNKIGGVGVAWNSHLIGYRVGLDDPSGSAIAQQYLLSIKYALSSGASINSNSWGLAIDPFDQQELQPDLMAGVRDLANLGRNGLGIAALFASGNNAEEYLNANYDPTDNIPYSIVVGASAVDGSVAKYSTPGASVLVIAPGSDNPPSIVTTDLQGKDGANTLDGVEGNYTDTPESAFTGTSAATPIAAGVVALMLEANPFLGYRDIQEILVHSSRRSIFLNDDGAQFNRASNWNGGGLLTGDSFGFGSIDAHNAVRLAETWQKISTTANLKMVDGHVLVPSSMIAAGQDKSFKAIFDEANLLEQITVSVDISAAELEDVTLELISPNGTRSLLIDRPPADDGITDHLVYTLNTVRNWGETLKGEWTLRLVNGADGKPVELKNWSIKAYASDTTIASTQFFTDEFSVFSRLDQSRAQIEAENGINLNLSAVTRDSFVNLSEQSSRFGDTVVTLNDAKVFRNVFTGDGDDRIVGNDLSNVLFGGRGNNIVDGRAGDDTALFLGERSMYDVEKDSQGFRVVSKVLSGGGTDLISNVETFQFDDIELPALSALEQTFTVASFYDALFDRAPDSKGLEAWVDALLDQALSEKQVALRFTSAIEGNVGALSQAEFVTHLYHSALERAPDPSGHEYWNQLLETSRADRGDVLLAFVKSDEYQNQILDLVARDLSKMGDFWS